MNLRNLSGWEIAKKIREKEVSVTESLDYFSQRIRKFNPSLNAVVNLFDNPVIPDKSAAHSPLWGVPVLIKDNISIKNRPITCASGILEGYISPYHATVIDRLIKSGLVILGTANMDEFAFGSSCETSYYGPALNPWDNACVPGGSSGGSAAAVAAGISPLALGSDTGGSIRQPAAFCGVTGFKPTYGRVSRFGLVAFGSSLDQIGTLSRDIRDCACLLDIISGPDSNDSTCVDIPKPDYSQALTENIKGLKIGLPKEYFLDGIDPDIKGRVNEAISVLKDKSAEIIEISLPHTEFAVPTYYILASSEASSNLSRFDGIRYGKRRGAGLLNDLYKKNRQAGFGKETKRRIMLGTFSLSSGYYEDYYLKALKVRSLIKQDFQEAFKLCDAILTPTTPTPAFKLGEKMGDPVSMYLSDIYTISSNLAGTPAVSIPCGFSQANLPVGLQIISKWFDEPKLINIAYSYQKATDWHKKIAPKYE